MLGEQAANSKMDRLLTIVLLLCGRITVHCNTVALGNLAVVFEGTGYRSTVADPLKGHLNDLWCQASRDGEVQPIGTARFVRVHDRKVYQADINDQINKATLIFGNVSITEAGKYRCEITTNDGSTVFGNMFAYAHPVVHHNSSWNTKVEEGSDDIIQNTNTVYGEVGESIFLECPVVGYPHPNFLWYKDGIPIDSNHKYSMKKRELFIKDLEDIDAGHYSCKAENVFPKFVDGPEEDHSVTFNQEVKIGGKYGWIYPLILILIILLLLFIIIYLCAAYKRYKADQYNVEKRERNLRPDETQRLADDV